jgi:hypothetical protein
VCGELQAPAAVPPDSGLKHSALHTNKFKLILRIVATITAASEQNGAFINVTVYNTETCITDVL